MHVLFEMGVSSIEIIELETKIQVELEFDTQPGFDLRS